jgi:hypothetical protein
VLLIPSQLRTSWWGLHRVVTGAGSTCLRNRTQTTGIITLCASVSTRRSPIAGTIWGAGPFGPARPLFGPTEAWSSAPPNNQEVSSRATGGERTLGTSGPHQLRGSSRQITLSGRSIAPKPNCSANTLYLPYTPSFPHFQGERLTKTAKSHIRRNYWAASYHKPRLCR